MHRWNNLNDGGDRDRPQMTDDDANGSQALSGFDITRHRACLSQDRPDLKFASMRVCCAMAKPSVRDMVSRGLEDTSRENQQRSVGFAGSRVVSWRRIRTLTGEATRVPVRAGWGHCSKLYRCLPPRASCTPQTKPHQKDSGSSAWRRTWRYHAG